MKKLLSSIAVISFVIAACSQKSDYTPSKDSANNDQMKVLGIIAPGDDVATTKSFYEYDDASKSYKTYWDKGDAILVTDGTGTSAVFTSSEIASCDESIFSGSYSTSAAKMAAIYPSSAASVSGDHFVITVNAEQKMDKAGQNSEWGKNDIKIGKCADAQATTPEFYFKNLLSVLEINLKLDASVSFVDGETVDYLDVETPQGTNLVGKFNVALDGSMSATSASNKVRVKFSDKKTLTSNSTVTALVTVAPGALTGDLKVTIRTNRKRTIVRTLNAAGLELKAGEYNSVNLTKIAANGAKYFNRFDIPKNLRVYDVSQNGMIADGGEVTIEWDDDIFDTAANEGNRYYTAQIASAEGVIQTTCANFQCTTSGIYGSTENVKPRLTISLLGVHSTYKVRVKLMWAPDEDYSEWFTFTTPERYSETQSGYFYMLDFAEVPGYGVGDPVNRCVSTFRGADFCQATSKAMTKDPKYDDWASRLHHNDAGVTATYRIGDTGAVLNDNSRGSWGNNYYVKNNWVTCGYVFERPGYVQLGSNDNDGHIDFDMTRGSTIQDKSSLTCTVEFDACVYNDASDGKIELSLSGQYQIWPIWYSKDGSKSVTIPANNRDHKFKHYSATVTMSTRLNHDWGNVKLSIGNTDKHRILIDNIKVTKSW